jgi:hypothetical protein
MVIDDLVYLSPMAIIPLPKILLVGAPILRVDWLAIPHAIVDASADMANRTQLLGDPRPALKDSSGVGTEADDVAELDFNVFERLENDAGVAFTSAFDCRCYAGESCAYDHDADVGGCDWLVHIINVEMALSWADADVYFDSDLFVGEALLSAMADIFLRPYTHDAEARAAGTIELPSADYP